MSDTDTACGFSAFDWPWLPTGAQACFCESRLLVRSDPMTAVLIRCACGRTLHLLHHRTRDPLHYPVSIAALRNGIDFAGECQCGTKWRFGDLLPATPARP